MLPVPFPSCRPPSPVSTYSSLLPFSSSAASSEGAAHRAMAASLHHAFSSAAQPNPTPTRAPRPSFCPLSSSPFFRLASFRRRVDSPLQPLSVKPQFSCGDRLRLRRLVVASNASSEEPKNSELDVEKAKRDGQEKAEEEQQAWRETLQRFKADALRMKAMTMQAYDVYSKKTMEVLMETSAKLRIQADKAQRDLSVIAAEVGEESQEYFSTVASNSPDSVRDIAETFGSLRNLNGLSDYKDYHVGVPFGTFLMVGGFLNFMLFGSISAIRFGFILGLVLLALSISSLRLERMGRRSSLLFAGQAAIATVIFFRELSSNCQNGWLQTLSVLASGAMVALYFYLMVTGRYKGPSTQSGSENN